MRYVVITNTASVTRPGRPPSLRESWQVVDVDAGLNERNYPKRIAASCADEGMARQIADHLNGVNPYASHWRSEAEFSRRELTDIETRWQSTLDFANAQAGQLRAERDALKIERDEARESARANGAEALRAREKLQAIRKVLES